MFGVPLWHEHGMYFYLPGKLYTTSKVQKIHGRNFENFRGVLQAMKVTYVDI